MKLKKSQHKFQNQSTLRLQMRLLKLKFQQFNLSQKETSFNQKEENQNKNQLDFELLKMNAQKAYS